MSRALPTMLESVSRVSCCALGEAHTVFLSNTGRLLVAGRNDQGQLEDSDNMSLVPRGIRLGESFDQIAAGGNHTILLADNCSAVTVLGKFDVEVNLPKNLSMLDVLQNTTGALGVHLKSGSKQLFFMKTNNALGFKSGAKDVLKTSLSLAKLEHFVIPLKGSMDASTIASLQELLLNSFRSFSILNASFLTSSHMEEVASGMHGCSLLEIRKFFAIVTPTHGGNEEEMLKLAASSSPAPGMASSSRLLGKTRTQWSHSPAAPRSPQLVNSSSSLVRTIDLALDHALESASTIMFDRPEQLRWILIVFEYPGILDVSKSHLGQTIMRLVMKRLVQLKESLRVTVSTWWQRMESTFLFRVVQCIQNFLTFLLQQHRISMRESYDESIPDCVIILKRLFKLNQTANTIPTNLFYNTEISENVDLKGDFKSWVENRGFSFCNFPFVLDPNAKYELLQIDAHVQMLAQVVQYMQANAFVHPMFQDPSSSPYLILRVRRDFILEDAMSILINTPLNHLKRKLKVSFANEEGVDEGGVQKEFFQIIFRVILEPELSMFTEGTAKFLYI